MGETARWEFEIGRWWRKRIDRAIREEAAARGLQVHLREAEELTYSRFELTTTGAGAQQFVEDVKGLDYKRRFRRRRTRR